MKQGISIKRNKTNKKTN